MIKNHLSSEIETQSKIFFDETYNKYKNIIHKPLELIKESINLKESQLISNINNLSEAGFSIIDYIQGDSVELLNLNKESDLIRIIIGLEYNSESILKNCFIQEINYKNTNINPELESSITLTPYTLNVSIESLDKVVYFNYFFKDNSAQTKFPHFSISGKFNKYDNEGFPFIENESNINIFQPYINASKLSKTLKEHNITKLMHFFYSGSGYSSEESDFFKLLNDYDLKDFNKFFLSKENKPQKNFQLNKMDSK